MIRFFTCVVILASVLAAPSAHAEIEKTAIICEETGEICFYGWPKLKIPKGWHQDKEVSYEQSSNMLVPDGATFANAEAVMYARALYKPGMPETKTLGMFIEDDKKGYVKSAPSVVIKKVKPVSTGNGKKLETYSFTTEQAHEIVACGEEKEYYLVFTVSAKSEEGLQAAMPTFKKVVGSYKEGGDEK